MRPSQSLQLQTEWLHFLLAERFRGAGDGLVERFCPSWIWVPGLHEPTDFGPTEHRIRNLRVQVVVVDFPPAANDASCWKVEPGDPPSDLDLLTSRQPVPVLIECALQHDTDVLQLPVEIRGRREAEAESHQLGTRDIDIEVPYYQRALEGAGAHLYLVDHYSPRRSLDGERVSQCEVICSQTIWWERVNRVTHFIPFTDPNQVAEVVGDDAKMISVIADVGWQVGTIPPILDDLLAVVRRTPIHFHAELVGLNQTGWVAQTLSYLCQEEHKAVRTSPVAGETRVSLNLEPAVHRPLHE
jgi:hypothetical protein